MQILIITIIFTLLDQLTKYLAGIYFKQPVVVIENLVSLRLEKNFGIAFSLPVPSWLVIIFTFLFLIFGGWWVSKEFNLQSKISKFCLGLIAAGAIGNLIDRLLYGYVIDFIAVWRWPVFNLADSWIFVGVLGILLFYGKIIRK